MTTLLWYLGTALVCYLLGSFNTAAVISRVKGFDIREKGSGNAGASNALVTMGKGAAALTTLVDMLKAFLPVFALLHWIPAAEGIPGLPILAGCMAITGHIFPFWMHFRGGKGFASLLGMTLAIDWRLLIAFLVITGIWLLTTQYIALATISCSIIFPIYRFIMVRSVEELVILVVLAGIMVWKHVPNLKRIKKGTEIGLHDVQMREEESKSK